MNPWGKSIMSVVQNKHPSHISFKININTLFGSRCHKYVFASLVQQETFPDKAYPLKTAHSFTSNQQVSIKPALNQVGFNFFSDCHFSTIFPPTTSPKMFPQRLPTVEILVT